MEERRAGRDFGLSAQWRRGGGGAKSDGRANIWFWMGLKINGTNLCCDEDFVQCVTDVQVE